MISYVNAEEMYARVDLTTGGVLDVYFDSDYIMLNHEFEFADDTLKDIVFMIGDKFYTGLQVVQEVSANWEAAWKEEQSEARNWDRHVREYRNP